jgi:DNA-binding protein YbaB
MSSGEPSALAGLGGGDPDEVERRMREWARGFQDKADRYRAVREETEQLRLTAVSDGGGVEVTVRADGTVAGLRLTEKVRALPLAELSALILSTMHDAQSGIAGRVGEVMDERLGDEDPQTREMTLANLRARFPEAAEELAPPVQRWDQPADESPEPSKPARPTPRPRPRTNPDDGDDGDDEDFIPWRT